MKRKFRNLNYLNQYDDLEEDKIIELIECFNFRKYRMYI